MTKGESREYTTLFFADILRVRIVGIGDGEDMMGFRKGNTSA